MKARSGSEEGQDAAFGDKLGDATTGGHEDQRGDDGLDADERPPRQAVPEPGRKARGQRDAQRSGEAKIRG